MRCTRAGGRPPGSVCALALRVRGSGWDSGDVGGSPHAKVGGAGGVGTGWGAVRAVVAGDAVWRRAAISCPTFAGSFASTPGQRPGVAWPVVPGGAVWCTIRNGRTGRWASRTGRRSSRTRRRIGWWDRRVSRTGRRSSRTRRRIRWWDRRGGRTRRRISWWDRRGGRTRRRVSWWDRLGGVSAVWVAHPLSFALAVRFVDGGDRGCSTGKGCGRTGRVGTVGRRRGGIGHDRQLVKE